MNLAKILAATILCCLQASCVSYSGVTKAPDGQLYISGGTNYVVFSSAWVRRCTVEGLKLNCEELSESPSKPKGGAEGGAAASTASAPPPAPAAPAPAPAPPPEPAPAPAKATKHK